MWAGRDLLNSLRDKLKILFKGILVPCMNVLIAHWFPLSEKSTAIAIATTGNQVSVVAAMFLTAELCQINLLGGWPLAFHSYGIIGVLFCIFWAVYVFNSPSKAKNISTDEVLFIQDSIHNVGGKKIAAKEVPWKAIFTSATVWATALNSFSHNFMTVGTITYIPSYYQTVLKMDLSSVSHYYSIYYEDWSTKRPFFSEWDYVRISFHLSTNN